MTAFGAGAAGLVLLLITSAVVARMEWLREADLDTDSRRRFGKRWGLVLAPLLALCLAQLVLRVGYYA